MIVPAIAEFFKYKAVRTVIFLTCTWSVVDQAKFIRQMSEHGLSVTVTCDPTTLDSVPGHGSHGVLYETEKNSNSSFLRKVKEEHLSLWYKWLIVGADIPDLLNAARYDADLVQMTNFDNHENSQSVLFNDIYVHPRDEISTYPWATWTHKTGLRVVYERERVLRRLDLKGYPLRISTPAGHHTAAYGSFVQYLVDPRNPEMDSAIRCGYRIAAHLVHSLNASEVVIRNEQWSSVKSIGSMLRTVQDRRAELGAGLLRPLAARFEILDYVMPIWPFSVGFTYIAERQSNSNMFVEPFSPGVWYSVLAVCVGLALFQRLTARSPVETEGAFIGVLATWLQQDASAVPEGASGRWTFMVVSTSAMLVHSYYTSAIVSSLMGAGVGGPTTLRELADSKFAIASEDYDYMRYLMFDAVTNTTDLEYLKKRKMTPNLYQSMERGVELIRGGRTAYHTEYNQIYPRFKTFTDDQLCKLKHVDTWSEVKTCLTASKRSQWIDMFRSKGCWLHETGLGSHVVSRLKVKPPPCRASLLAERVNFGDVIPALALIGLGALLAVLVLAVEIWWARMRRNGKRHSARGLISSTDAD